MLAQKGSEWACASKRGGECACSRKSGGSGHARVKSEMRALAKEEVVCGI